ncbi:MAG: tRNA pseudouridine(55) synthase TruB, partial [Chloroflexi bacterium]|nr:tRNA pseudouridine(55) synthase TruB [Chloroflexota bacterium]
PRLVEVVRIALARCERPRLWLEVACGPGTYIRSLAHDLGQALGCGAHLTALVRTRSGPFTLAEAIALPQLEQEVAQDTWRRLLYPADHPLVDLPAAVLDEGSVHSMRHGQPMPLVAGPRSSPSCAGRTAGASKGVPCRAYGVEGAFLGVLAWQPDSGRLKPWKVLASAALAC